MERYIDIKAYIKNADTVYAHTREGGVSETLQEHINCTERNYERLDSEKNISIKVKLLINSIQKDGAVLLSDKEKDLIFEMFRNAVILHDLGKINPNFQRERMNNNRHRNVRHRSSQHALISSLLFMDLYHEMIWKEKLEGPVIFLNSFAYIISRHHTYLEDFDSSDFINKLEEINDMDYYIDYANKNRVLELQEKAFVTLNNHRKLMLKYKIDERNYYILNKLLYTMIVSCDYYATYEYMHGKDVAVRGLPERSVLRQKYENTETVKKIRSYQKDKTVMDIDDINRLRSDIFLEAEKSIKEHKKKMIYYLEGPTGSGKTNTSINLALTLLEENKDLSGIFYIFPFNTLIEQTADSFSFLKEGEDFIRVNSITPIVSKEELRNAKEEKIDYDKILLDYQFMHYPIILTSHVNLFSALFGTGREANLWLQRLCNSVIILDEIQGYKNEIWRKMIEMLKSYTELFHIKLIIMSATLPKLDELLGYEKEKEVFTELLPDKNQYFSYPLFKNRVSIHYELLEQGKIKLEKLVEFVVHLHKDNPTKQILVEFIKKTTAREFYNALKEIKEIYEKNKKENAENEFLVEISGDDNKYFRRLVITMIKTGRPMIIVATQVIEAGVDIDTDLGLKDISTIDSEEQFLGRINRSCRKKDGGKVWFFDLDDAKNIYSGDIRTEYNLLQEEMKKVLETKDFNSYYSRVLTRLKINSEEYNVKNIQNFFDKLGMLQFKEVEKELRLIDQKNYQIFLNYEIEIEGKILKGCEVWQAYKSLISDRSLDYAVKQIQLSAIRDEMQLFLFNITIYGEDKAMKTAEEFGGLYYYENGTEFMEDGKFNRKKFDKYNEDVCW